MRNILKNENINKQAWDRLLNESPTASWFQSYNCYQFYKKLDFLKPFAIAVADHDKILALVCGYVIADGGLVKRFMSRRAIVPGGVMISKNTSAESIELLLNEEYEFISGEELAKILGMSRAGVWKHIKSLKEEGYTYILFNEKSAREYISSNLKKEHLLAFDNCYHPAMKSDYFRLCYINYSGGMYVDSDDVYHQPTTVVFVVKPSAWGQPRIN